MWITNVAILLGAQLNAERERDRQIAEGEPGAERELRLGERDAPKEKARPQTA
jgi:membrane protein